MHNRDNIMNLELERKKIELKRVQMAKDEMTFKILQRMEDIKQLEGHIAVQDKTIKQLEKALDKEV